MTFKISFYIKKTKQNQKKKQNKNNYLIFSQNPPGTMPMLCKYSLLPRAISHLLVFSPIFKTRRQ